MSASLKTMVQKANRMRNDEHFIVGVNRFIDTIKQWNEEIAEIAIIFNPATVQQLKNDKTPTLYKVKLDDLFITKTIVDGEAVECEPKTLKTQEFINHMDDNKMIYDHLYLGPTVYQKLEMKSAKSVIFWETDYTTHEQGSNVYTIHNYKVVNL